MDPSSLSRAQIQALVIRLIVDKPEGFLTTTALDKIVNTNSNGRCLDKVSSFLQERFLEQLLSIVSMLTAK
jgi:hypothetical protein